MRELTDGLSWPLAHGFSGLAAPARGLTRTRVLEAALDLLDRHGLEALSMRRLAADLGVEAPALYNHVANKHDLLVGIVDLLHCRVALPPADADWRAAVRLGIRSLRAVLLAHPDALPLFVGHNASSPDALRPIEAGLRILRTAGFGPAEAVHALRTLVAYTVGYAGAETGALRNPQHTSEAIAAARTLPTDEFPTLRELAAFSAKSGDAEFEFGLDTIMTGLEAKLPPR